MVDIHTHILPGIDDGAVDVDESLDLLRREKENGVDKVFLTPHFVLGRTTLEEFLASREHAYNQLLEAAQGKDIPQLKLGAEVRYTPELMEIDLSKLTLGDSAYLLLELPFDRYPTFIEQFIDNMKNCGITVILAHVERYAYFRARPSLLVDLLKSGVFAQVTAERFVIKGKKSFAYKFTKKGLAQFIASDTHNPSKRPPCQARLNECLTKEQIEKSEFYANSVWNDDYIPPVTLKKTGWFFK